MKRPLETGPIAEGGVVITCSSHENRCRGLLAYVGGCTPRDVVLFHYDDPTQPTREYTGTSRSSLPCLVMVLLCSIFQSLLDGTSS